MSRDKPDEPETRRDFLRQMGQLGLSASLCPFALGASGRYRPRGRSRSKPSGERHEVEYYEKLAGQRVRCKTCPHECTLSPGSTGLCRSKTNFGGKHYLEGYGSICVLNVDPIEKNPLYHVLPGSTVMSVAGGGCNLRCLYCQNWEFSQKRPREVAKLSLSPALAASKAKGKCKGIAFTYTDPVAYYEYAKDAAKRAKTAGLISTFCTGGYIHTQPLKDLCRYAKAFTITLKAFSEAKYRELAQISMAPVLESMQTVKEEGLWLEVVSLIVPGYNDDLADVRQHAKWIVKELGPDVPWHFSRFVPAYKMRVQQPTPIRTLEACRNEALDAGLRFVYITNVAPHEGNHTYCPSCGKAVVERLGFRVLKKRMYRGKCSHCRKAIPGVWA